MKIIGIILIVAGILALIYTGFSFKTEEKLVDVGPLELEKEKKHSVNWPPFTGAILILGGAGLMVAGRKK